MNLKDVILLGREAETVFCQVSDGSNSHSNGTLCQWAMPAPLRRKLRITDGNVVVVQASVDWNLVRIKPQR